MRHHAVGQDGVPAPLSLNEEIRAKCQDRRTPAQRRADGLRSRMKPPPPPTEDGVTAAERVREPELAPAPPDLVARIQEARRTR